MPKQRTEEQFPLLLFLVGDQEVSQTNKRFLLRGRFSGITSGATAIITEWPNYLSSCWITALICGATLFVLSMLLTSCVSVQYYQRVPRCASNLQRDRTANRTVHLVHSTQHWSPDQMARLRNFSDTFPNYTINLLLMHKPKVKANKRNINTTMPQAVKFFKTEVKPLGDVISIHPNIVVSHSTYNELFENTPLYLNWVSLSEQMKVFAARTLLMWQFGGLSFDMMEFQMSNRKRNITSFGERKLQKLLRGVEDRYEKLAPEVVSVDSNGLHMECKTPCHVFFEKVLMMLTKATEKATPKSVLKGPLRSFCADGVVDREFCHI